MGKNIVQNFKIKVLKEAANDFRYLLNRGYPRKASLEIVGNRYGLTYDERHLLHRGIFSKKDANSRLKKKISINEIRNRELAIDGYNVFITIEAGLSGRPIIFSDDGFMRDISGISKNYKESEKTEESIKMIFDILRKIRPRHILFIFDSPISHSGRLAQKIRKYLEIENLPGDAQAVKVPERILIGFPGIVATSDTAIIDKSKEVIDLAGYIIMKRTGVNLFSFRFPI